MIFYPSLNQGLI